MSVISNFFLVLIEFIGNLFVGIFSLIFGILNLLFEPIIILIPTIIVVAALLYCGSVALKSIIAFL